MKISTYEIKEIPKNLGEGFCVFGKPNDKVQSWINFHEFKTEESGKFTNIIIPANFDIINIFESNEHFKYVDGFSPNLNKHLHLGHVSNFVLAKSFQKLGVSENFIANLGDTLDGEVDKNDALNKFGDYCKQFNYKVGTVFFASHLDKIKNIEFDLEDGEGEYIGTQIVTINEKKVVCKRSNGSSTYFYQDMCLAKLLNNSTLYLTGFEQLEHFKDLKALFPQVNHLPLGLVTVNGEKMSSRKGNVIFFHEILEMFKEKFGDNEKLIWNVLAGYILKSVPSSTKNIDLDHLDNVKLSQGLYLSYVLAKLKSAGLNIKNNGNFTSNFLKFKYIKAKNNLAPNMLFEGLVDTAKTLSGMYEEMPIKNNEDNQKKFQPIANDLLHGMELIGMFDIDKV